MKAIITCMATAAGLTIAGSTLAATMPVEVKELKCLSCHAVDHKVIGPAWRDVGKKYKGAQNYEYNGKEYPLLEGLVKKVSNGSRAGTGNWGTMPMPAEDPTGTMQDKIRIMIKYVLSLS
jgi:cytochrome c